MSHTTNIFENGSNFGAVESSMGRLDGIPVFARVRASEAARLSEFSARCFDQTYGPMCRAADVDAHIAEWLSPSAWLKVLTDPTAWVFSLTMDDGWAAYAHVRLAPLPEGVVSRHASAPRVTPIEIARFYVARKWQGRGVAQSMLHQVLAHAAAQGAETVWLSSWQENARGNAFYAKEGFERIGTTTFLMGEDLQSDYVLERVVRGDANVEREVNWGADRLRDRAEPAD